MQKYFATKSRNLHLNSGANVVRFAPLFKCKRLRRAGKRRKTGNGRRRVGERPSSGLWPSRVGCLVRRPLRRPSGLGVGLTLLYELVARFRRRPQTSSLVPAAARWTREWRRLWRRRLKRFTCGPHLASSGKPFAFKAIAPTFAPGFK